MNLKHHHIKANIDLMLKSHFYDDQFTTEYTTQNEEGNYVNIPLRFMILDRTDVYWLTTNTLLHFMKTLPDGFFIRINSFEIDGEVIYVGKAYSYKRKVGEKCPK